MTSESSQPAGMKACRALPKHQMPAKAWPCSNTSVQMRLALHWVPQTPRSAPAPSVPDLAECLSSTYLSTSSLHAKRMRKYAQGRGGPVKRQTSEHGLNLVRTVRPRTSNSRLNLQTTTSNRDTPQEARNHHGGVRPYTERHGEALSPAQALRAAL